MNTIRTQHIRIGPKSNSILGKRIAADIAFKVDDKRLPQPPRRARGAVVIRKRQRRAKVNGPGYASEGCFRATANRALKRPSRVTPSGMLRGALVMSAIRELATSRTAHRM